MYNEAVDTLTAAISHTDEESEERAVAMALMGKAFGKQNKLAEAKKFVEISLRFFDKQESYHAPSLMVLSLTEISEVCEVMKEIETSMLILKRLLKRLENLPREQHFMVPVTAYLGKLLLLNDQAEEAVPYLENAIDKMKQCDWVLNHKLAFVYNDLGAAYLELDRPTSATQAFENARDFMVVYRGPNHVQSLGLHMNICRAYVAIGRESEAMDLLKKAVEGLKGHGAIAKDLLDNAIEFLDQLKGRKP